MQYAFSMRMDSIVALCHNMLHGQIPYSHAVSPGHIERVTAHAAFLKYKYTHWPIPSGMLRVRADSRLEISCVSVTRHPKLHQRNTTTRENNPSTQEGKVLRVASDEGDFGTVTVQRAPQLNPPPGGSSTTAEFEQSHIIPVGKMEYY